MALQRKQDKTGNIASKVQEKAKIALYCTVLYWTVLYCTVLYIGKWSPCIYILYLKVFVFDIVNIKICI